MPVRLSNIDGANTQATDNGQLSGVVRPDRVDMVNSETNQYSQSIPNEELTDAAKEFLMDEDKSKKKKKKRFSFGKFISLFLILTSMLFMAFAGFVAYRFINLGQNTLGQDQNQGFFDILSDFTQAANPFAKREPLKGESSGRTNFLLLGKDTAAGLTDTIMIASYYHDEREMVTVNIPRDFFVYDGYGSHKINAVYPFAEARFLNTDISGGEFLSEFLSEEYGIDMHYWLLVDFDGVESIVDTLDGIEVDVERTFTDYQYPNNNYGFIRPAPTFTQGETELDGEQALIYARSRKGNNGEGSDFARAKRQSIVIQGILEKAKSAGVVSNVSKFDSYLNTVQENFKTNMKAAELRSFAELLKDVNLDDNFYRAVWSTGNGIICDGSTAEAYLIKYCGGAVAGKTTTSYGRTRGQEFVKNLLLSAKLDELFDSEVAVYGNASNDSTTIFNELKEAGFRDVKINNRYAKIDRATANSVEKIEIYITDSKLRDLFNKLEPKPEIEYQVKSEIPDTLVQPKGADAKIVIWVESIE